MATRTIKLNFNEVFAIKMIVQALEKMTEDKYGGITIRNENGEDIFITEETIMDLTELHKRLKK